MEKNGLMWYVFCDISYFILFILLFLSRQIQEERKYCSYDEGGIRIASRVQQLTNTSVTDRGGDKRPQQAGNAVLHW